MINTDVLICTPGNAMNSNYVLSLLETISYLNKSNIKWEWVYSESPIVSLARQKILNLSKKYNYKKIFFIDSDISWSVENFKKIYFSEKDMITGGYFKYMSNFITLKNEYEICASGIENNKNLLFDQIKNFKENIEIFSCGLGFVSIKKEIIDLLEEPFLYFYKNNNNFIKYKNFEYSEDFSFCLNVKELNYQIYLDPTVIVNHHKTVALGIY